MRRFRVRRSGALRGSLTVPGDKSIGHRALLFASLAEGASRIRGLSNGLDNHATRGALEAMGVRFQTNEADTTVEGVGLFGLKMPKSSLDCGNSGTTMRLLAGIVSAQKFGVRLVGDASLSSRPMRRIVEPLRARGAHIAGVRGKTEGEHYAPLSIAPLIDGESLTGLRYESPIASAQVKSCLLLSGLYADGPTTVYEPLLSRDHTERMMLALGVPLSSAGTISVLDPAGWVRRWDGFDWTVPGDLSSAAFFLVAGAIVEGSEIEIEGVGTNPTRTGILDALRQARASIELVPRGDGAGNEPVARLVSRHDRIAPVRVGGEIVTRMIDEVPILCALAACAEGRTDIRDAEELRAKESDRLSTMASTLRAFGVDVVELQDGLTIHGMQRGAGRWLTPATVNAHGDHRIAMTAVVLGLVADGESIVEDVACVETSFPGFAERLRALGADLVEEEVEA
ncbi:MAG: 3-phosphoshikimate 1-carboxyvinyltransferase [Deltaproteobacteria bacterium]|nr:3-phosphoshikimate 1-carboxyvinyltransferase [Deltaproteobacteria bacterium]